MISVIAGWIAGWSAIGAWRMMTRDALFRAFAWNYHHSLGFVTPLK
jgi:hypothetical protein